MVAAWGGEAERTIEWSERGMRLSPFDPWAFAAYDAQALGHFRRGRYADAASAAYKQMAAALAKLGRLAGQGSRGPSTAIAPDLSLQQAIRRR